MRLLAPPLELFLGNFYLACQESGVGGLDLTGVEYAGPQWESEKGFNMARLSFLLGILTVVGVGQVQASVIYTTSGRNNNGGGTEFATIQTSTGSGSTVGQQLPWGTFNVAFDLNGTLYATTGSGGVQANTLSTVNLSTGATSLLGSLPTNIYGIDFDPQGNLYGIAWSGDLYRLDKSNGSALQLIGNTGVAAQDISFNSSGSLFGTVAGHLYTFDTNTAAVTSNILITGTPMDSTYIVGIMFDQNDTLFAISYEYNSRLFTIDPSTGAASTVGFTGLQHAHGGDIYTNTVPEPSTLLIWSLLGTLALGIGWWRRRKGSA